MIIAIKPACDVRMGRLNHQTSQTIIERTISAQISSNMNDTVSIPALKQYLHAASDLGVNSDELVRNAGFNPDMLSDNNQRISLAAFEHLLRALITASGHPNFGLHASRFVNPTTYLSLGLMSMSAERLRDSIELMPTYEPLVGAMGVSSLQAWQGDYLLRWECRLSDTLVRRHVIDTVLSSWYRYGKEIVGLSGDLLAVYLEHDADGDSNAYEQLFACKIYSNAERSGLLLPADALEQAQPQADAELLNSLQQHANASLNALQQTASVSAEVQSLIEQHLDKSTLDKAQTAALLGMSARTLQRRLQAEGSSFHTLLNTVRLQRAKSLLRGDASMDHIASQLGFAETRSFFRRFKQWTGMTAGEYRSQSNRHQ